MKPIRKLIKNISFMAQSVLLFGRGLCPSCGLLVADDDDDFIVTLTFNGPLQ